MVRYLDIIVEELQKISIVNAGFTFDGDELLVEEPAPSSIYGNQIALPGTLPDQAVKRGSTIKAKDTNVAVVDVNGFKLEAGESVPVEIDNLNKIFVTGNAGDIVYYLGS